jgi:hypothetical protein
MRAEKGTHKLLLCEVARSSRTLPGVGDLPVDFRRSHMETPCASILLECAVRERAGVSERMRR